MLGVINLLGLELILEWCGLDEVVILAWPPALITLFVGPFPKIVRGVVQQKTAPSVGSNRVVAVATALV